MDSINETTVTNYKVRAFTNSNDPDFIKALKIYSRYISPADLTDTNQVTFCLDNYNQHYKGSTFIVGGFYQNRELIGYCQFIYISEEKLIIIDYIAIDEQHRGISVFYAFIEKIRELIAAKGYEVKYIVGEINLHHSSIEEIPTKAKLLIKLLKSCNFGEIKSLYVQPMLGVDNYESEQRSILMLSPSNQYEAIKRETFLKIVEAIYFKHYERWYKLFLEEDSLIKYQKHLYEVFNKVSEKAVVGKLIIIEKDEYLYDNREFNRQSKDIKSSQKALLIFGFVGLLILLTILSLVVNHFFNIEYKNQLYLLLVTGILYLLILSLFSRKAAKLVNRIIEKAIEKLT